MIWFIVNISVCKSFTNVCRKYLSSLPRCTLCAFQSPPHTSVLFSRINKPGKAPTKIIDLQYVKIHFRIFNHIRHTNIGAHELWKSSEDYNLANMIGHGRHVLVSHKCLSFRVYWHNFAISSLLFASVQQRALWCLDETLMPMNEFDTAVCKATTLFFDFYYWAKKSEIQLLLIKIWLASFWEEFL